jgi:TPR repeat protein
MRTKTLFVAMLLALAPLPSVAQDFDKGLAAYKSGDYATALREFTLLAALGDSSAQFNLAVFYDKGLGVLQDSTEAARWYRASAEQGHAGAQFNLAVLYDKGLGVLQDYTEAARWYRASAKQGYKYAQNNLGILYGMGQGVSQDYVLAHMWQNIAAANGNNTAADGREIAAGWMTPTDISEAQRRARVCMASNYQDCE